MPKVRAGWQGKYKLEKHEFYVAYHYALQYNDWLIQYNLLGNGVEGIKYDKDKVQTSPSGDTLEKTAIKRADIRDRMELVEQTAREADPVLYPWILKAVTNEGVTYNTLHNPSHPEDKQIPCGKNMYYAKRRKFYWLLSKKLMNEK